MWRAVNADGTLNYTFVESVKAAYPYYVIRFTGGVLYLTGMLLMAYNTYMTMRDGEAVTARIPAVVSAHA
jgi:cytochrome c oxidase cbb3-type subunit 1